VLAGPRTRGAASSPCGPREERRRAPRAVLGPDNRKAGRPRLADGRGHTPEPLGLHEARHTYVSLMHAAGCSLEEIGDFVGHSSTYMVDRYRHLLDGQRERAAERLNAFLTGARPGAQEPKTASLRGLD
jgi:integrase